MHPSLEDDYPKIFKILSEQGVKGAQFLMIDEFPYLRYINGKEHKAKIVVKQVQFET